MRHAGCAQQVGVVRVADLVSADSACLRIRSCAAWKDVVERRLATGQGPRRAMFAAGVSAGDGPGRPGLVPQG